MACDCYLCNRTYGAKSGTVGTAQPEAVCQKCGVLACQAHCERDQGYPRTWCLICLGLVVAASTSTRTGSTSRLAQALRSLLARLGGDEVVIRSVEEFLYRHPAFAALWNDSGTGGGDSGTSAWVPGDGDRSAAAREYVVSLDDTGRRLLLLAFLIFRAIGLSPEELPGPVAALYREWA